MGQINKIIPDQIKTPTWRRYTVVNALPVQALHACVPREQL